jgi:hypothetical protein
MKVSYQFSIQFLLFGLSKESSTVVGDLDEPYLAKTTQRSSRTGLPGYIGWIGHGSSLCRVAGLSGYSAEWD